MAASKLPPAERLIRKRRAARLRQQRCRARKRLARVQQHESVSSNKNDRRPPKKRVPTFITTTSPVTLEQPKLAKGTVSPESCNESCERSELDLTSSFESREVSSFDTKTDASSLSSIESLPPPRLTSPPVSMDTSKEYMAINAMLSLRKVPSRRQQTLPEIIKPVSRYPPPRSPWYPYMRTYQQPFYPVRHFHYGAFHVPFSA